jgi:hypothetical protein
VGSRSSAPVWVWGYFYSFLQSFKYCIFVSTLHYILMQITLFCIKKLFNMGVFNGFSNTLLQVMDIQV